ncbi:hypothetical protein EV122DRAFT_256390 [Schizophyllum commune]
MTQLPDNAGLPANVTPDQLQAIMLYLAQNQIRVPNVAGAPSPTSSSATLSSLSSISDSSSNSAGPGDPSLSSGPGGPVPLAGPGVPPPAAGGDTSPPPTPRTPANRKSRLGAIAQSAPQTPSSKLAQLTLEGNKLTFEETTPTDGGALLEQQTSSANGPSAPDNQSESDPYEGFPEIVTAPPKPVPAEDGMEVDSESSPPPSVKRSPKKKARVQSPRRSPPRARASSKKKSGKKSSKSVEKQSSTAPATSSGDAGPSPAVDTSEDIDMRDVDEDAVRTLETWLAQVKQGRPLAELGIAFTNANASHTADADVNKRNPSIHEEPSETAPSQFVDNDTTETAASHFIDDEAEECDPGQDDADDEGNLGGFIVPDNVVEYDGEAPALPDDDDDDDDRGRPLTRLHRRSSVSTKGRSSGNDSEVEIVDKVDKGKGRAVPLPASFLARSVAGSTASAAVDSDAPKPPVVSDASSATLLGVATDSARGTSGVAGGSKTVAASGSKEPAWKAIKGTTTFYPGSMAVNASANVCPRLTLDDHLFSYASYQSDLLTSISFAVGVKPVPGDCAFISDFSSDGYGNPNIDVVAAAETNIHRNSPEFRNLILGLMLRRQGCFINDATVDPAEIMAVQVSPAGSTLRYKSVLADTRAPAVSITPGVVRTWSLDAPTTGPNPVCFLTMTPMEGLVDRLVGSQCMIFGQRELVCTTVNNAIRFATVPTFGRPAPPVSASASKMSSSMRRNAAGSSMRRSVNFEPTTNDPVPVLDARHTKLPDDIGLWTTVLPRFEGPLPDNAVAFVAHTTSMWHNLVFVVIIGDLPTGYV